MTSPTADLPPLPLPPGITSSYIPSHDLTYHVLSSGTPTAPLLLLLHGFPELAFSWRKIMPALAARGYHVVAYDQRGYGRTTGWDTRPFSSVDLSTFTFTRLVRDAIILVHALGYTQVKCVVGHDFGGVGASMCALMRPDIFQSVIIMSHPFKGSPSLPFNTTSASPSPPTPDIHHTLAALPEPRKLYKWYYSSAPAASEMDHPSSTLHSFLRGYFHLKSADWAGNTPHPLPSWSAAALAQLPLYYTMPLHSSMRSAVDASMASEPAAQVHALSARWLPDAELAVYTQEWRRTGFQGGLNWYRVATDAQWHKDTELFAGLKITVPCLFVAGRQDWGTYQEPGVVEGMGNCCTRLRGVELLEGAGHWVQQEQPEEVIRLVLGFLQGEDRLGGGI